MYLQFTSMNLESLQTTNMKISFQSPIKRKRLIEPCLYHTTIYYTAAENTEI